MPWKVFQQNEQYCVYKIGGDGAAEGDALGCHPTREEADAQMAALYANDMNFAAKFAADSETDVEGLLAPYGGPFNGRDVDGEYFSPKTEFALDWFAERPLLYHHGMDGKAGLSVVGRIKALSKDELGLWMKAQLDAAGEYYDAIKELIKQGKLGLSSGSMRHLVEVNVKTGEITRWPLVEGSLTPTPANPMAHVDFPEAKSHYKAIGVELPDTEEELRAAWTAKEIDNLPDSSFAFVEAGGDKDEEGKTTPRSLRHFPYRNAAGDLDEAHVMNALGRIPQSALPQADKDKALAVIDKAAKELGIGEGKALQEGLDAAGGYLVPEDEKAAANMAAHTDVLTHPHAHANGTEHSHPHAHAADMLSHDGGPHAGKSVKTASWEDVRGQVEAWCQKQMAWANPFEADCWCYVEETYSDYCIVEFNRDGEERYFKVPFTLDANGDVSGIGQPEEMEETYIPVAPGTASPMGMGMMAATTQRYVATLAERTKDLHERRTKEGRVISTVNRQKLQDCLDGMSAASDVITALLSASEPPVKAEGALRRFKMLRLGSEAYLS